MIWIRDYHNASFHWRLILHLWLSFLIIWWRICERSHCLKVCNMPWTLADPYYPRIINIARFSHWLFDSGVFGWLNWLAGEGLFVVWIVGSRVRWEIGLLGSAAYRRLIGLVLVAWAFLSVCVRCWLLYFGCVDDVIIPLFKGLDHGSGSWKGAWRKCLVFGSEVIGSSWYLNPAIESNFFLNCV